MRYDMHQQLLLTYFHIVIPEMSTERYTHTNTYTFTMVITDGIV